MNDDFGFLFWIHLLLIILIYLTPFLFSWWIVVVFVVLYYLQLIIFGDCVISKKQFGDEKRHTTFYAYYLSKMGFEVDKKSVRIVVDYIIPPVLIIVALILQLELRFEPLLL